MTATATYTKLRSGDWGVRVPGSISAGDSVTVAKRDGSTKQECISKVVWSGNGVTLCAISPRQSSGRASYGGRYSNYSRRGCAECGEIIRSANQRCWETGSTCYAS